VVAETLKVLLVAVTAAAQLSPSNGGDGGAASLMRVLLPLLIQVLRAQAALPAANLHACPNTLSSAHAASGGSACCCHSP
jgi:hypothetical protein